MPHFFFWPWDIGPAEIEKERTRAKTHMADGLRVGVLGCDEGAELRLEGHLMACEQCREPAISLWESIREQADPPPVVERCSCAQARNAVMRHLESGRELSQPATVHLMECVSCADHFVAPAKALHTLEVDEDAVAGQD